MFKVGDVVVLKSGGPAMTVQEVPYVVPLFGFKIETYKCSWFSGDSLVHGDFHETTLILHRDTNG